MFKKLLSNLPFNPSLIGQVSFYAQRVHSEASVRRSGLVVMVLAMLLQMFAITVPPEYTLAESPNDIIRGGFTDKDQAVSHCTNNTQGFKDILSYYQIDCDTLSEAKTKNIRSTSNNKQLHSLGRTPQGQIIKRTGKPTGEYAVKINDNTYYMKNLWAWDSAAYSTYKALEMKNLEGDTIRILFNCGNIVTTGEYSPPQNISEPEPEEIPEEPQEPNPAPEPTSPQPVEPIDVCPRIPGVQTSINECRPCDISKDSNDIESCVARGKSVENVTQGLFDANNTTANNGDEIIYTLTTHNTSKVRIDSYTVSEDLNDVLNYADIVDLHGGSIDDNNLVSWPDESIEPSQKLSNTITVRVKDNTPQTPSSVSDPGHYDLVMTNVYGNATNIELEPGLGKSTEAIVNTLPSTGPGETLGGIIVLTFMISYFFARARLTSKELAIVKANYNLNGSS